MPVLDPQTNPHALLPRCCVFAKDAGGRDDGLMTALPRHDEAATLWNHCISIGYAV